MENIIILEKILANTVTEDNVEIPLPNKYILSEIVNGAIEYAGGKAGEITYMSYLNNKELKSLGPFEKVMGAYFDDQVKDESNILTAIKEMIKVESEYDSNLGIACLTCELYKNMNEIRKNGNFSSPLTFKLNDLEKIKKLTKFKKAEKESILEIANNVRKYIDSDLEYLKDYSEKIIKTDFEVLKQNINE